jgi:hypothetical protein
MLVFGDKILAKPYNVFGFGGDGSIVVGILKSVVGCKKYLKRII